MALTTNLTAYYKLDETSGNAADSSGNGFTLTNTGSSPYGAAKINNGALGTGTTVSALSIANELGFNAASSNTWNFWYKSGATMSGGYILDNISNATDHLRFIVYEDAANKKLHLFANGNEVLTAALTDATWYMITVTKSGTNWTFYVNTTSQGTTTTSTLSYTSGPKFMLLNDTTALGSSTTATIDEVGIWSRVLTVTEITTLYNSGAGLQYPFGSTNTSLGFFMMM